MHAGTSDARAASANATPIVLYGRPQCHLCDEAKPIVAAVARDLGLSVEERNVEDHAAWEAQFGSQIPVAFYGPRKLFKYRVERSVLATRLTAALRVAGATPR